LCELPAIVPKCWAEAPIKIARMTLTIKLDGNWNSFQLANNTPPLSVTGSVIAPSARMAGAQPGGASIKTPVRCNVSRRWLPAQGRKEGINEGRKERRNEVRKEGRKELFKEGIKEGRKELSKEGRN
jgi:hypothetical protein